MMDEALMNHYKITYKKSEFDYGNAYRHPGNYDAFKKLLIPSPTMKKALELAKAFEPEGFAFKGEKL